MPYEFTSEADLPSLERIELPPPVDFSRSHPEAPVGAWSDDGAQALCLLDSLLECGRLDLDDLGQRLLRWRDSGYLAVDGVVFDVGMQTSVALDALRGGIPADDAGLGEEECNGNGSLMRVLPLALWHHGSDQELARDAARQSIVTHAHPRAQVCCALYCLWVRAELNRVEDSWSRAVQTLRALSTTNPVWMAEIETHICPDAPPDGSGSGYVVDSLHSARLAAQESTFERIVQRAVSLGNDTDTTAAIAGGIAGVRHGFESIPARWISALAGSHVVVPLSTKLMSITVKVSK